MEAVTCFSFSTYPLCVAVLRTAQRFASLSFGAMRGTDAATFAIEDVGNCVDSPAATPHDHHTLRSLYPISFT